MDFMAQVALDMAAIMTLGGQAKPITYDGVGINAIPEISEDNMKGNQFATTGSAGLAYFWVLVSDVPIVKPGSKIIFNNEIWRVARLFATDGIMHRILCTGKESVY